MTVVGRRDGAPDNCGFGVFLGGCTPNAEFQHVIAAIQGTLVTVAVSQISNEHLNILIARDCARQDSRDTIYDDAEIIRSRRDKSVDL